MTTIDLDIRRELTALLSARLQVLGVAPSTFERDYHIGRGTFQRV